MEKWSVELGWYHIEYEPRTAIKGQVLIDFIVKFTDSPTGLTKGQQDSIVAPVVQPTAPTGGQQSTDAMDVDNIEAQQDLVQNAEFNEIKKTRPGLYSLMGH